jgi:hypothetical protein
MERVKLVTVTCGQISRADYHVSLGVISSEVWQELLGLGT